MTTYKSYYTMRTAESSSCSQPSFKKSLAMLSVIALSLVSIIAILWHISIILLLVF